MVVFKNRYMIMEVFLDPNKDLGKDEPIIISQHNVTRAIKDSILKNFGECGLASALASFQGSIRACKDAVLNCDEAKFQQYKAMVGENLTTETTQHLKNYFEKIKLLEH